MTKNKFYRFLSLVLALVLVTSTFAQEQVLAKNKVKIAETKIQKLTPQENAITVKWKKVSKTVSGYEIEYATNKKFDDAKTKKVAGSSKTSCKLSELSSGTKYFVKLRAYYQMNGKTFYAAWSKAKAVVTKSAENKEDGDNAKEWCFYDPATKKLTVKVYSNASTGFRWMFLSSDVNEKKVKLVDTSYESDYKEPEVKDTVDENGNIIHVEPMRPVGVGGTLTYEFKVVGEINDPIILEFRYLRSWNPKEETIDVRYVSISADAAGKISVLPVIEKTY